MINTALCDSIKGLMKEDFIPEGTSNFIHCLAPFLAAFPIFVAYALVPFAPDFSLFGYQIWPGFVLRCWRLVYLRHGLCVGLWSGLSRLDR